MDLVAVIRAVLSE